MSTTNLTPDDVDGFVNEEIDQRMTKLGWKRLDICFKWMALQRYMDKKQCAVGSEMYKRIKELLQGQQLMNVEYDSISQSVIRINHKDCKEIDDYVE